MATNDPNKSLAVEAVEKGARELEKTARVTTKGDKSNLRQRLLLNNQAILWG